MNKKWKYLFLSATATILFATFSARAANFKVIANPSVMADSISDRRYQAVYSAETRIPSEEFTFSRCWPRAGLRTRRS